MKSITIKDRTGKLLLKVIDRKNKGVEIIAQRSMEALDIEVRDDKNCKVWFREWEVYNARIL